MKRIKFEELHDLRIIMKSGASIVTKKVRHWSFSATSYSVKWPSVRHQNIGHIDPSEIAAVEIIKRRWNFFWG